MALAGAVAGAGVAWWMHRRTNLSPRNVYLAWALSVAVAAGSAGLRQPLAFAGALVLMLGVTVAAVLARRWRVGALGAGGELREFELARVMAWSPQRRLSSRDSGGTPMSQPAERPARRRHVTMTVRLTSRRVRT